MSSFTNTIDQNVSFSTMTKNNRISPNVSTEHHQNHWYFNHHHKIGVYNWKQWPCSGQYNIMRAKTYTSHLQLSSVYLRCLATTHPQACICPYSLPFTSARQRGEKQDISVGSIAQDRVGKASNRQNRDLMDAGRALESGKKFFGLTRWRDTSHKIW